MAPLTPILDGYYSRPENQLELATRQPLLCCVILMISSRYHTLPAPDGQSRGYLIHARLWDRCKEMIMGLILGQDQVSDVNTRTFGSIEALLLLSEWQPRGLHDLLPCNGWDFTVASNSARECGKMKAEFDADNLSRGRWLREVIHPARKFDNMSWMTLGCAFSLASGLGVIDRGNATRTVSHMSEDERQTDHRCRALEDIIHIYQDQLATRLGRRSMVPPDVNDGTRMKLTHFTRSPSFRDGEHRSSFINAWKNLEAIARSINDVLFPSTKVTKEMLTSGRYVSKVDHFQSLLSRWQVEYLRNSGTSLPKPCLSSWF